MQSSRSSVVTSSPARLVTALMMVLINSLSRRLFPASPASITVSS